MAKETKPKVIKEPKEQSPMALIAMATEKGVDVQTMEKLMDLQERWEKNKAKKAFDKAMADFQSECPVIRKDNDVKNNDGSKRYSYAPLDSIVQQVRELLRKHGFSYTTDAIVEGSSVKAICKVTHEEGHSEISSFQVPIDPKGFMNEAQKFASALTFAKRYAFCNAFGILTGDEDDDSQETASTPDPVETAVAMIKASKNKDALEDYKLKVMKSARLNESQKSRIVEIVDIRLEELK